ncbi:MAG TPA: acetate--CoA ligase [Ktedonobacterales bacterium]|jgi:acetyl-CoA synthetase|nr:acetate--CoA ligase [Ktedonobacterales bacterium]
MSDTTQPTPTTTPSPDNWESLDEPIAWRPSEEYLKRSRLLRFMQRHGISEYDALLKRASDDPSWFWDAVSDDLGLVWQRPYTEVMDTSRGPQWTKWYVDGQFNYVATALDQHASGDRAAHTALIWEGEDGEVRRFSYAELQALTNQAANALRTLGVGKGDRVGIYMPMIPEVVAATLACGKLGAVYTPIFSGYGAEAIATRLRDSGAKVLVTADGFYRRSKVVPMKATADAALAAAPNVEHVLVVRRIGGDAPWTESRDVAWDVAVGKQSTACETLVTDAEDPYMLIYTSGTTGRPKGAVHAHCGFPIKGAQDMAHCFDVQPDDTLFWLTDMGWMMGPWAVSGALMLGATLAIYEGAVDYPDVDRLWAFAERHKVTVMGIAPTVVRTLMTAGDAPVRRHDLSALRILGSSGEPWNSGPWHWLFDVVGGGRCPIINYSGGTEVSGGIVGCVTIQPIKPCSFSGAIPGMSADVVDDSGQSVRGQVGELVIRTPWPGMTRGFWQDPARYEESYWTRFPGIWTHGDFAAIDSDGFWYILGRSDDTIKVAGKRLGPAEVESAAVAHPDVSEAAAIGAPHPVKGEVVVVFAVLRPGVEPSDALRDEVRASVTQALGPALKPESVLFVSQLPKTRNGKVLRRLIRARHLGKADLGDLSSLESPDALEAIGHPN